MFSSTKKQPEFRNRFPSKKLIKDPKLVSKKHHTELRSPVLFSKNLLVSIVRKSFPQAYFCDIYHSIPIKMKKILNYFLQGCLFIVPIVVTLWVLLKTIFWIDGLLPFQIPIKVPGIEQLEIPGLGLLTIFVGVALIGYIGAHYIRNQYCC